ncbi:hypothetical protein [Acinetobacter ursingii]|uniref:hypothetical protein n=1 Tax=Acinetobacter ursingii TaxID=108980 RepID=UPI00029A43B4|nr:hypothetical protein [Acinetobacter ursingii]ENV76376.1 hypothetical protein F944_01344 [Acinetobacter ursingii DSM 16037 = CIP 107286]MCU4495077.1 hypothetical protein [Acinetobacter ursingii]PPZ94932.1 hypothetical protein C5B41_07295 [Acinetobacter ursingii]QQT64710.1 hypothetical protein I6I52_08175 [Acinetobacter ursingii]UYF77749.1 hypothetical protein LSO59_09720 [Acinetobacter ursingii]
MARYVVTGKVLPENLQFGVDYKCRKIRKSSGKLLYKITKDDSGLSLYIENIVAKKRKSSYVNVVGTVANSFNLTDVLAILQLNSIADTVAELLPFLGDRNNAGFVTAVLVDLGLVKII